MDKIVVAQTILSVVPRIDEYCNASNKANHIRAINSYYGEQDTERLMERIIDKAYQSQQLHNLKVKTIRKLDAMPEKLGQVLKFYFLKGKSPLQIATALGVSERTVFRRINQGTEEFAAGLEDMGISILVFRQLLERNKWLRAEYERQQLS